MAKKIKLHSVVWVTFSVIKLIIPKIWSAQFYENNKYKLKPRQGKQVHILFKVMRFG